MKSWKNVKPHTSKSRKRTQKKYGNRCFLKPKQLSNGEWMFKDPSEKDLKLLKSNKDLMELMKSILADSSILEKLITKFKVKYNYKVK